MDQEWGNYVPREERITHLWVTVYGTTGTNGLNGKSKEHDAKIEKLSERLSQRELLEAQVRVVWRTLQWVGIAVGTTVGVLLSGPGGTFLANVIRAGLK